MKRIAREPDVLRDYILSVLRQHEKKNIAHFLTVATPEAQYVETLRPLVGTGAQEARPLQLL
jgi:hypothetical protein